MSDASMVFVVDDDADARQLIAAMAQQLGSGVRSFACAEEFLEWLQSVQRGTGPTKEPGGCCSPSGDLPSPACGVLDVGLPGINGLELLSRLRASGVFIPVIITNVGGDVPAAVLATKLGAVDYLEKPLEGPRLATAIQTALTRDAETRKDQVRCLDIRQRLSSLSERERQVLDLLLLRLPIKQIGSELGTSPHTVRNQRSRILKKMDAVDDADLIEKVMLVRLYLTEAAAPIPVGQPRTAR